MAKGQLQRVSEALGYQAPPHALYRPSVSLTNLWETTGHITSSPIIKAHTGECSILWSSWVSGVADWMEMAALQLGRS